MTEQPWEAAWEIHKHEAAEAAHVRWMQTKQAHGFADHPHVSQCDVCHAPIIGMHCGRAGCCIAKDKHHSDMIPFADLTDEIKAYDYETAIIGFKFGFEAAIATAEQLRDALVGVAVRVMGAGGQRLCWCQESWDMRQEGHSRECREAEAALAAARAPIESGGAS